MRVKKFAAIVMCIILTVSVFGGCFSEENIDNTSEELKQELTGA